MNEINKQKRIRIINHLVKLIKTSKEPGIKNHAIETLADMGAVEAIELLSKISLDENENYITRIKSIQALGKIGK